MPYRCIVACLGVVDCLQYVSLCMWDDLFRVYFLAINVGDATSLLEHLRSLFYEQRDILFGGQLDHDCCSSDELGRNVASTTLVCPADRLRFAALAHGSFWCGGRRPLPGIETAVG